MVYKDFKDFLRRTSFDKGLRDYEVSCHKAFNFAKKPKYDGH